MASVWVAYCLNTRQDAQLTSTILELTRAQFLGRGLALLLSIISALVTAQLYRKIHTKQNMGDGQIPIRLTTDIDLVVSKLWFLVSEAEFSDRLGI